MLLKRLFNPSTKKDDCGRDTNKETDGKAASRWSPIKKMKRSESMNDLRQHSRSIARQADGEEEDWECEGDELSQLFTNSADCLKTPSELTPARQHGQHGRHGQDREAQHAGATDAERQREGEEENCSSRCDDGNEKQGPGVVSRPVSSPENNFPSPESETPGAARAQSFSFPTQKQRRQLQHQLHQSHAQQQRSRGRTSAKKQAKSTKTKK